MKLTNHILLYCEHVGEYTTNPTSTYNYNVPTKKIKKKIKQIENYLLSHFGDTANVSYEDYMLFTQTHDYFDLELPNSEYHNLCQKNQYF